MLIRPFFVTISVLFLAGLPHFAFAQFSKPIAVAIGGTTIDLPTPSGYEETSKRSPQLWKVAQALSQGDGRGIALFVHESDLAAFQKGIPSPFSEYFIVQTPRKAEQFLLTQAQFDKLRSGMMDLQIDLAKKLEPRLAGEVENAVKGLQTMLDEPISAKVGDIVPIGVNANDTKVLSYSILTKLEVSDKNGRTSKTIVISTAFCFVKGKVVMLIGYREFKSSWDISASRTQILGWANALFEAN